MTSLPAEGVEAEKADKPKPKMVDIADLLLDELERQEDEAQRAREEEEEAKKRAKP